MGRERRCQLASRVTRASTATAATHLRSEVSDEDGVLGAAVITGEMSDRYFKTALQAKSCPGIENVPSVDQATAGGPVQLEGAARVRDRRAVERQSSSSGLVGREFDETVSGTSIQSPVSVYVFS